MPSLLGNELPQSWEIKTLKEVTTKIGSGSTPRGGKSVYVEEGTALIRSQNVYDHQFELKGLAFITDEIAHSMRGVTVNSGDILINITGDSILRTTIVPDEVLPARVNQHVAIIRIDEMMNSVFVQKWLASEKMKTHMFGFSSGGTRKAITKGHIESFPVPVPSRSVQDKIADVLATLDEGIKSNQRIISILTDLIDTFAVHWSTEVESCNLGDLGIQSKGSVNPQKLGNTLVDHLSIPACDDQEIPERTEAETIKSNKLTVSERSVLVSRLNPRTYRSWFFTPDPQIPAMASTEFMVLQPLSGNDEDFAALWLAIRNPEFKEEMARRVTGTSGSHQRVRPNDALEIKVPSYTHLSKDKKDIVMGFLERKESLSRENTRLAALRDKLLPELLSGRLAPEDIPTLINGGEAIHA